MYLPSLPPAALASFAVALLLVLTKRWHGRFSMDGILGIQKMHTNPTPRIGGIAIFAGVFGGWIVSAPDVAKILGALILAGLPAFVFGLAEDLTKQVSVVARLLATMACGVLGWWMTGYSLTSVDVPVLDVVLLWVPVSVLFTAFAVGGVAKLSTSLMALTGWQVALWWWRLPDWG
jgi:UDP-N-acetylmuramyl pentapeptide phosphotransferase/UDP-N-acetylglucosamine-1-phosphate transferase